MSKKTFTHNNKAILVKNGDEFIQACVRLIRESKEKILLHTYIFEEDEVTAPVIEELIKKAREGVQVFLLMDAFGTPNMSDELKSRFEAAGVHYGYFAPLFSMRMQHFGRRLHQKVLVADNDKALTGGINFSKKFICPDQDRPWLDYAVLIEGEEVYRLQRKIKTLYLKEFPGSRKFLEDSIQKKGFSFAKEVFAKTLVNDFMRFKTEIQHGYIQAIAAAEKSIKITATYFLPGKRLLRALKKASKRGVEIELIFGKRSDHNWERWSARYLYSWYLSNNFKIYEWEDSILHAKAAVIDGKWSTIGSYNHNYLSRYTCLELNVEIENRAFASHLENEFSKIKERSFVIDREDWERSNHPLRAAFYFITYQFSHLLSAVSHFFVTRSKERVENDSSPD